MTANKTFPLATTRTKTKTMVAAPKMDMADRDHMMVLRHKELGDRGTLKISGTYQRKAPINPLKENREIMMYKSTSSGLLEAVGRTERHVIRVVPNAMAIATNTRERDPVICSGDTPSIFDWSVN